MDPCLISELVLHASRKGCLASTPQLSRKANSSIPRLDWRNEPSNSPSALVAATLDHPPAATAPESPSPDPAITGRPALPLLWEHRCCALGHRQDAPSQSPVVAFDPPPARRPGPEYGCQYIPCTCCPHELFHLSTSDVLSSFSSPKAGQAPDSSRNTTTTTATI